MTAQAQTALNAIEDRETTARPTKRTFEEAVAYAVSKGYVWLIWGGKGYRIVNGKAYAG